MGRTVLLVLTAVALSVSVSGLPCSENRTSTSDEVGNGFGAKSYTFGQASQASHSYSSKSVNGAPPVSYSQSTDSKSAYVRSSAAPGGEINANHFGFGTLQKSSPVISSVQFGTNVGAIKSAASGFNHIANKVGYQQSGFQNREKPVVTHYWWMEQKENPFGDVVKDAGSYGASASSNAFGYGSSSSSSASNADSLKTNPFLHGAGFTAGSVVAQGSADNADSNQSFNSQNSVHGQQSTSSGSGSKWASNVYTAPSVNPWLVQSSQGFGQQGNQASSVSGSGFVHQSSQSQESAFNQEAQKNAGASGNNVFLTQVDQTSNGSGNDFIQQSSTGQQGVFGQQTHATSGASANVFGQQASHSQAAGFGQNINSNSGAYGKVPAQQAAQGYENVFNQQGHQASSVSGSGFVQQASQGQENTFNQEALGNSGTSGNVFLQHEQENASGEQGNQASSVSGSGFVQQSSNSHKELFGQQVHVTSGASASGFGQQASNGQANVFVQKIENNSGAYGKVPVKQPSQGFENVFTQQGHQASGVSGSGFVQQALHGQENAFSHDVNKNVGTSGNPFLQNSQENASGEKKNQISSVSGSGFVQQASQSQENAFSQEGHKDYSTSGNVFLQHSEENASVENKNQASSVSGSGFVQQTLQGQQNAFNQEAHKTVGTSGNVFLQHGQQGHAVSGASGNNFNQYGQEGIFGQQAHVVSGSSANGFNQNTQDGFIEQQAHVVSDHSANGFAQQELHGQDSVSGQHSGSGNPFFQQSSHGDQALFDQKGTVGFPSFSAEGPFHQEEVSGSDGGLSVSCSGIGKICVAKHLCSASGYVVNRDISQLRSGPQVCEITKEVCCTLKKPTASDQSTAGSHISHGTISTTFGTAYDKSAEKTNKNFATTSFVNKRPNVNAGNEGLFASSNTAQEDINGYLPPIGSEPSDNVPAFSRPPSPPQPIEEEHGELSPTNVRPNAVFPPAPAPPPQLGCAAALICVEDQFCDMKGTIRTTPIVLSEKQLLRRVPLSSCKNPDNGIIGKCCRDPNYVDPWPAGNLPANYSGGFDEQGFPTFLNIGKTRLPKKQPTKNPTGDRRPTKNPVNGFPLFTPTGASPSTDSLTVVPLSPQPIVPSYTADGTNSPVSVILPPATNPNIPSQPKVPSYPIKVPNYIGSSSNVNPIIITPHVPGSQCGVRNTVQRPNTLTELEVGFGEIPWEAMILLKSEKRLLCSGSIIAPNAILTAANCVEGYPVSDIAIKTGEWKLGYDLKHEEPLPVEIINVATIAAYPATGSLSNNVAILFLEHNMKLDQHVDMICLPQTRFPNPGQKCISTGWGKNILELHAAGALMHSIEVDVLSEIECQQRINAAESYMQMDESLICTKAHKKNNNMCQVDPGGPLACDRGDGHYEIFGAYSQDTGCLPTNQVAAFASIDTAWVKKMLANPPQPVFENESTLQITQSKIPLKEAKAECNCEKEKLSPASNQYLPPQ